MSQAEPTGPLEVRTASAAQTDLVLELLRSASSGRRGAGNVWGSEFPDVLRDLPEGLVYLAWAGDRAVGAFVLRWSDELLWGPDDGQGGYLHRLAAHPDVAGQGIGRRLVDTAGELTARQGRRWLRLDCDQGNQPLRAYYEAQGFRHVRDVGGVARQTRPGYRAGSLYQRPAHRGAAHRGAADDAGTGSPRKA